VGIKTLQGSGKDGSWILLSMAVTATPETNSIAVHGPEVSTRWSRDLPGLRREREVSFFSCLSLVLLLVQLFSLTQSISYSNFTRIETPSKQFFAFFLFSAFSFPTYTTTPQIYPACQGGTATSKDSKAFAKDKAECRKSSERCSTMTTEGIVRKAVCGQPTALRRVDHSGLSG
jgi:hypothetical protein